MIGVKFHETANKRAFAHARRANDADESGWPFLGGGRSSVVLGDVFLLLSPVEVTLYVALRSDDVGYAEGSWVVAVFLCAIFFSLEEFLFLPTAAARFSGFMAAIGLLEIICHCSCGLMCKTELFVPVDFQFCGRSLLFV